MNISDFHIPSSHKEKYFNPYSHFARDTDTDRFTLIDEHDHGDEKKKYKEDIHEYKICEIRPPSIEKVLNTDFYHDISNGQIFVFCWLFFGCFSNSGNSSWQLFCDLSCDVC